MRLSYQEKIEIDNRLEEKTNEHDSYFCLALLALIVLGLFLDTKLYWQVSSGLFVTWFIYTKYQVSKRLVLWRTDDFEDPIGPSDNLSGQN